MRRSCAIMVLACLVTTSALRAADETSDQLRRMYDDAVAQMRAAQDRRNELARENEVLKKRLEKLEKLEKVEKELADTQTQLTTLADSTFQARIESAALDAFMQANPAIKARWDDFRRKNSSLAPDPSQYVDPDWPFACKR